MKLKLCLYKLPSSDSSKEANKVEMQKSSVLMRSDWFATRLNQAELNEAELSSQGQESASSSNTLERDIRWGPSYNVVQNHVKYVSILVGVLTLTSIRAVLLLCVLGVQGYPITVIQLAHYFKSRH